MHEQSAKQVAVHMSAVAVMGFMGLTVQSLIPVRLHLVCTQESAE